jgi:Zn-dependent protease with chaperone function
MSLALNLVAVFVLVGLLVSLATRLLSLGRHERPATSSRAAALIAPVIVAASICSALLWPGVVRLACHCVTHGLHHPHLCLRHPDYATAALVPASLIAATWFLLVAPRVAGLARNVWQTKRWIRRVSKTPHRVFDDIRFHVIDAPGLGACTTGFLSPRIAVDDTLWRRLSADERRAVLHHEEAHRQRRDPLTLLVLEICSALVPTRAKKLVQLWQKDAETECDRHAAEVTRSADSVAAALLAIARYQRETPRVGLPLGASAAGSELEGRVRVLLADNATPGRAANLGCDFFRVTLIGSAISVVVTLTTDDWVHHAAETLLGLFVGHH